VSSRLTFTPANHSYWIADADGKKQRAPSVSALKKTLHQFDAERWVLGQTADAAADAWDGLVGLPQPLVAEEIRRAGARRVAEAREFGTAVHHYAESLWTGEPVEVPDEYVSHVTAIAGWFHRNGAAVRHAEAMVWADEGDFGESAMAGRFDLIVHVNGRGTGLLDLKTWRAGAGGHPRQAEWAFQLAAYSQMEHMVDPSGDDVPMPVIDWCGTLHVGPSGAVEYVLPLPDWSCANDQVAAARVLKALPNPKMEEML
jgi:hypothetical protein